MGFRDTLPMVRDASSDQTQEREKRLALAPFFSGVDPGALRAIVEGSFFRSLKSGEVLWRQGSHAYELSFVWQGALAVVRQLQDRVSYRIVRQNEVIGFSNAIGRIPCSVDVVAQQDSRLLLVPGDTLRSVLTAYPEVGFRAIAYLGQLVASLSDQVELLHHGTLRERVLSRLEVLSRGQKEVVLTHAELAEQVAARRESVTRLLKTLEAEGVVTLRRGRIEVHGVG